MSRSRRTCHAVPGSSERFIEKATTLAADEIFLDLEDAVAPSEKDEAREMVVAALNKYEFTAGTVAVRINATDTQHYYRDVIALGEQAGDRLDTLILPKAQTPGDIEMTDKLLTQIEMRQGFEIGKIGIEAQIEDAAGLLAAPAIASASPRMQALVFGPGDYSASIGIPVKTIGGAVDGYPGDHLNAVYTSIVVAARAAGIQALDGPYVGIKDEDGLRERSQIARALGFDGKWTIHPSQIGIVNDIFSPSVEEFDHAVRLIEAYRIATDEGRGAAMFEGQMIDEATRKIAERVFGAGQAAGMVAQPS